MQMMVFTILLLGFDQLIKFWIRNNLAEFEHLKFGVDFVYLTFIKNRGAAFGILSGQRYLFIFLSILLLILLSFFYYKNLQADLIGSLALSFILAGGLSNLIDRFWLHYVLDFLAFNLFSFSNLPVINLADILICIGSLLLIYRAFLLEN